MPTADPWDAGADPWARAASGSLGWAGNGVVKQPGPKDNLWQDYRAGTAEIIRPPAGFMGSSNGHGAHNGKGGSNGCRRFRKGPGGERLEIIDWQGQEIVPVTKDFCYEHPTVAARSEEECEEIRVKNSIRIIHTGDGGYVPKPVARFEEAPFPDWAAEELRRCGFDKPTPIQVQSWPVVLRGHDLVGIAETGSGKTIAYVLPMLVHIMAQPELRPGEGPVGLVLVPTRDLCLQVTHQIESFTACTKLVCRGLYGGEDIDAQARDLAQRMDICVATPGRLIALLNNKLTNLRRATFLVLDEADELLEKGFGEQVCLVLGQVRPDRQALLFSATWPSRVEALAREVCSQSPIHINVGSMKLSACKTITQRFIEVSDESKPDQLMKALGQIEHDLNSADGHKALVFCNSRSIVMPLVDELKKRGFLAEGFSAERSQWDRDNVLKLFAAPESNVRLLVCTQILGRGHDFQNVLYVINYDMPSKVVEYIHRIGRTGRAGSQGFALTFMTENDLYVARDLVMVLRESQQEVPDWLAQAAKRRHMKGFGGKGVGKDGGKHGMAMRNSYMDAAPVEDSGLDGWMGRGSNRRKRFLAECGGKGAALAWS